MKNDLTQVFYSFCLLATIAVFIIHPVKAAEGAA
jgi:hypothetical protein